MTTTGSKKIYRVWARNESGASIDVDGKFSSVRAAENAARAQLGSGWIVTITATEIGFAPYTVVSFTIR